MKYALVNKDSIIENVVAHDPALPHGGYEPPTGLSIMEVNDWLNIGDNINAPEPVYTPTPEAVNKGISDQLSALDEKSVRALRSIAIAVAAGTSPGASDVAALQAHETAAAALRLQFVKPN